MRLTDFLFFAGLAPVLAQKPTEIENLVRIMVEALQSIHPDKARVLETSLLHMLMPSLSSLG